MSGGVWEVKRVRGMEWAGARVATRVSMRTRGSGPARAKEMVGALGASGPLTLVTAVREVAAEAAVEAVVVGLACGSSRGDRRRQQQYPSRETDRHRTRWR
jgi:hypothetical protein